MTENTNAGAVVDEVVAEVIRKGRQKAAEPTPETPSPSPSPFAHLTESDAIKLVAAIGNARDGELAWLARRIEAARERETEWYAFGLYKSQRF